MKLVFAGTPEFAAVSLQALLRARHEVTLVLTQPDRPAGRGLKPQPSAVKRLALECGLGILQPATLKDPAAQGAVALARPEAMVVAAYGLILPPTLLALPARGCINVHASLLPRWRGAAPIQRALLAGDARTGITIMQMDEGLDTGAILLARAHPILPSTNAGELHDALAVLGATLIVAALQGVADGTLAPHPQPAAGATYAKKLTRDEERIDWTRSAIDIGRQVRAFAPAPGAWFEHAGERIKVLAAVPAEGGGTPGVVVDDLPSVACGAGRLVLTRLQRAGRAPLAAAEFLRGCPLPMGSNLGGTRLG